MKLVAESLERLSDELRTIIIDNPSWDAEMVDDVVFDKLNHIMGFDLSKRVTPCPFAKIISYC